MSTSTEFTYHNGNMERKITIPNSDINKDPNKRCRAFYFMHECKTNKGSITTKKIYRSR